ncbi:hypothetical protein AB0F17_59600 [Nonomuraea sp. NPDC026600]|uniref:hypothetical protein n=1 Tax=Nonomuraea sp. NPDC026600 TaxID=3155363 RepID=UPI0034053C83
MTTTLTEPDTSTPAADAESVTEAEVLGAMLSRLRQADAAELIALARTCPATGTRTAANRALAAVENLRRRLVDVVAAEHRQAQADQQAATAETHSVPPEQAVANIADTAVDAEMTDVEPAPLRPARAPARPQARRRRPVTPKPDSAPPVKARETSLDIEHNALMVCLPFPPTEQEAAAVRRLCQRYAASPTEFDDLIHMLGVVQAAGQGGGQ